MRWLCRKAISAGVKTLICCPFRTYLMPRFYLIADRWRLVRSPRYGMVHLLCVVTTVAAQTLQTDERLGTLAIIQGTAWSSPRAAGGAPPATCPTRRGTPMKSLMGEFRAFIMRGNMVDLAVAVVIGVAFGAVITALVQDVIMPILGIFGGKPNFDAYYWVINGSQIKVGSFLTALVSFVIIAAVIFFLVIKPLNAL